MKKWLLLFTVLRVSAIFAQDSSLTFGYQTTTITQWHPKFRSAYMGDNSLEPRDAPRSTLTGTLYLTLKLGRGTQIIFNPQSGRRRRLQRRYRYCRIS